MNISFTPEKIEEWDGASVIHVRSIVNDTLQHLHLLDPTNIKVLDVGANVGKYIELLSEHCSITGAIMVEPVKELCEHIKRKFPDYTTVEYLISDIPEVTHLYVPPVHHNLGISRVLNPNGSIAPEDIREMEAVTLSMLLAIHPEFHPDIVKIDVEGYDQKAVIGLLPYLINTGKRPLIMFECAGNVDSDLTVRLCEQLGYTYWCRNAPNTSRDVFMLPPKVNA